MDYKEQSKMYWKMIVTLQRLLQTQYQRESDLMYQLQQCTCPENNPKYQYEFIYKRDFLDDEIRNLEELGSPASDETLHQLKHDRAELKDELYQVLINVK